MDSLPDVSKEFTSDTIEVGCSHISGLYVKPSGLGPSWASAHREPISETRPRGSTALAAGLGAGPTGYVMRVLLAVLRRIFLAPCLAASEELHEVAFHTGAFPHLPVHLLKALAANEAHGDLIGEAFGL